MATVVAALVACGRDTGAPRDTGASEGDRSTAERAPAAIGSLANGDPMPPAEENGGVPPYPGAIVWTDALPPPGEFRTVHAFTPDSFPAVVAFYDQALSDWRRSVAEDAVHYHRDPDLASVIVSPWGGEAMGEGGPEALRETRTSIGIAWRAGP